jgi:sugar O-acyltransferase (sialic acid O-acetyltransferase NeuD family)
MAADECDMKASHDDQPRAPGAWLVYGARGFALTVADLLRDAGNEVLGFFDDVGQPLDEAAPFVGTRPQAVQAFHSRRPAVALGIGYNDLPARWLAWRRLRAMGWPVPPVVHPRAYVARNARVSDGCMVMAGAIVDRQARLGEAVVLWPAACVNHDADIGDNCFLSPNATICGYARVGGHSFVGAGAMIADRCEVPAASFLKMGARFTAKSL